MQKLLLILPLISLLFSCTRSSPGQSKQSEDTLSKEFIVSTNTNFTGTYYSPLGVAAAPHGILYVCAQPDYISNDTIRKVAADGTVSSFATVYGRVSDIACDTGGNLYVLAAYQVAILRVTPAGIVSLLAGGVSGQPVDGQGRGARFASLNALDIDSSGILYVADYSSIRKVDQTGRVTTIYTNSPATAEIEAISTDNHQNIFFQTGAQVWRLDASGNRTLVAGGTDFGGADGTGGAATFEEISELRMDKGRNLWVADGTKIRRISPSGAVSTVAGDLLGGFMDGEGDVARFYSAVGLAIDSAGTVFVADSANKRIRKIVHK